jgi:hypothetical protein
MLLDKANSLLDEVNREEKSGFKAQIKKETPSYKVPDRNMHS